MAVLLTPATTPGPRRAFRRKTAPRHTGPARRSARDARSTTGPASVIRCASCGTVVTREEHRISVDGAHQHTRTNPHGLRFTFACFDRAPGCRGIGSPTPEWTWFPGYEWQVGVCEVCGTHLGWVFGAAGTDTFHGLITERITAEQ